MGVALHEITELISELDFQQSPSVLDIGAQNLYRADADSIVAFIRRFNDVYDPAALKAYAMRLSLGSQFFPGIGGINGAWLGDLLVRAGIDYRSFDIFDGYRTTIFDLNRDDLDPAMAGTFDLVLNAGTTEHVLNQLNCFKVIHEAAKVGGLIYHSLPMTAHLDHGYFNYNPRLHLDIANANRYEIVWLKIDGPEDDESIIEKVLDPYSRLGWTRGYEASRANWQSRGIPSSALSILIRKTVDAPFREPMETTTTAGPLSSRFAREAVAGRAEVRRRVGALTQRHAAGGRLTTKDLLDAYRDHHAAGLAEPFPLILEKLLLSRALKSEAGGEVLRGKLAVVNALLEAPPAVEADPVAAVHDSERALIRRLSTTPPTFEEVMSALSTHHQAGAGWPFPLRLEKHALELALAAEDGRQDLRDRLGKVDRLLADAYPLSTFAEDEAPDLAPQASRHDEAAAIAAMPAGEARFRRLVRLWWDYFREGDEDRFPADLELLAVEGAMDRRPDSPEIKVWLGRVLAKLLPEQPIARAEAGRG